MEGKVSIGLKRKFPNHRMMVGLSLSLTFRRQEIKKRGILILSYKQRLLFEKSKESDKFKEMYKKNGVSKTRKCTRKVSKTQKW